MMFRKALKFFKNNETRLKRQKFIRLFKMEDKEKFWREVKKLNSKKKLEQLMESDIQMESLMCLQISLKM